MGGRVDGWEGGWVGGWMGGRVGRRGLCLIVLSCHFPSKGGDHFKIIVTSQTELTNVLVVSHT